MEALRKAARAELKFGWWAAHSGCVVATRTVTGVYWTDLAEWRSVGSSAVHRQLTPHVGGRQ